MEKMSNNFFSKYKIQAIDVKSKLLSRSLLWMSLGLMVIIFVAWLSSTFQAFNNFVVTFSIGSRWGLAWLFNLIIIFSLFFCIQNKNINIMIPVILYAIFAIYEGMFITTILEFTGTTNIVKDLLLYMLIPSFVFLVMGIIAYTNLINFSKLIPFTFFGFFAILILSLIMIFTPSKTIEMLYIIIASAMFIIWIGVDLQMIARTEDALPNYVDKSTINRISFMFGVKLFIDFVNLLMIVLRIFRNR